MLSRHPSLRQSYLSAHLRCAAHNSRVSTCWLYYTTSVVVVSGKTSCVPSLFHSCTAAQASPRMHLNSICRSSSEAPVSTLLAVYRLLLNAVRPPSLACDDHRLLLNALRLLCSTCRGLHVLPARLSLHVLSSQACHLLEVRTIMFWTLRFCIPLQLSWYMHTVSSSLDLRDDSRDSFDSSLIHILILWNIFWYICTRFSLLLGHTGLL